METNHITITVEFKDNEGTNIGVGKRVIELEESMDARQFMVYLDETTMQLIDVDVTKPGTSDY